MLITLTNTQSKYRYSTQKVRVVGGTCGCLRSRRTTKRVQTDAGWKEVNTAECEIMNLNCLFMTQQQSEAAFTHDLQTIRSCPFTCSKTADCPCQWQRTHP